MVLTTLHGFRRFPAKREMGYECPNCNWNHATKKTGKDRFECEHCSYEWTDDTAKMTPVERPQNKDY